ncbi:MAG: hypothetical protein HQL77_12980 [Magnetococcales bacterium]|nr:hypothetical protein [Magnetococcales bacterium]
MDKHNQIFVIYLVFRNLKTVPWVCFLLSNHHLWLDANLTPLTKGEREHAVDHLAYTNEGDLLLYNGLDHRFGQSASKMLRFRLDSRFRGNDKQLQSQRFFRHSRESGNPE